MLNNHDQAVNRRPLAPVVVDEELADAIGAAISENLGELERAVEEKLERKFSERLREVEHKFAERLREVELAAARMEGKHEARGSRGRR